MTSRHDTLRSLPLELLGVIFSFVRAFFRIRVLALVCKRWHKAVYHSLTKLPGNAPKELISRLPNLTSVLIDEFQHGLILPATVRKLNLNATVSFPSAECPCMLTSTISSLTSLTLLLHHFGECPYITAMVILNASSITVLRITAVSANELNLPKILALRFPSLAELHLVLGFSVPTLFDFITCHSKHLRRLLLSLPNPSPLTGPFPVLQELRLQSHAVDLQTLPDLLRDTHSTLTVLGLCCWGMQLPDIVKAAAMSLLSTTSPLTKRSSFQLARAFVYSTLRTMTSTLTRSWCCRLVCGRSSVCCGPCRTSGEDDTFRD